MGTFAVIPVLVGPLQVLLTILPGILLALLSGLVAFFKPTAIWNLIKLLWRQKVATLVLIGGVVAGIFGWRQLFLSSFADTGPAGKGADWTTARFDLSRRGVVPGAEGPAKLKIAHKFKDGPVGFLSSPAVVGDRLYIASAMLGTFTQSGEIYCFSTKDLKPLWIKTPPNYRPTFSSPVVSGHHLVCGEGVHDTRDARVICMDLRPGKGRRILWTFETKNHVECTPVVSEGKVFVGAGDDGLYCLDLEPTADGEAKLHWHAPPTKYPDAETSLAVHEGKVYVGLGNGGKALCVLDAATGNELQRVDLPYPVFSPPSIADGKLYLGLGEGDYVREGGDGEIRCFHLADLKTEWTFPLKGTVLGAVAITSDKLYFCCRDKNIYALTREGKLAGKFNTQAPLVTSPAVTDKRVYAINEAGSLFALDRHSLDPVCPEIRLGAGGFVSSPVVANGKVFVGTTKDGLFALGTDTQEKPAYPLWTTPLGGPGKAGNGDDSPLPDKAEILWHFPPDTDKRKEPATKLPIAAWKEDLYVPIAAGKYRGLVCLPSDTAKAPEPRWHFPLKDDIVAGPVVKGNAVAVATLDRLYTVDRVTGRPLGEASFAGKGLSAFDYGILASPGFPDDQKAGDFRSGLDFPAVASATMIATAEKNRLNLFDRPTGRLLWTSQVANTIRTAPVLGKARCYFGTDKGLEARSLVDGEPVAGWIAQGGPVATDIAVRGTTLLFGNDKGELLAVDRDSGAVVQRVADLRPGVPPLTSAGRVLVANEAGLAFLDLDQKEPFFDLQVEDLEPAAPMVLHNSRIYVPTATRGLVCVGNKP